MIDIKRSCNSNIRDFAGEKIIYNSFTVTISYEDYEELWEHVIPKFIDEDVPSTEDLRRILEEVIEAGIYSIGADPGKRAGLRRDAE